MFTETDIVCSGCAELLAASPALQDPLPHTPDPSSLTWFLTSKLVKTAGSDRLLYLFLFLMFQTAFLK